MSRKIGIKAVALGCVLALVTGCSVASNGATLQPASPHSRISSPPAGNTPSHRVELQVISGLGVNANSHSWKNGELKPAIDKIAELGEVTWRVIVDKADWDAVESTDRAGFIDWNRYSSIYENGKMTDLWATIKYINSKPGQQVMVNVMGGVPAWMGGNRIDESREDHWVRMIASMVAYGRTIRGLDFKLLGPMNEPDWNGIEGPQVGPEQYVRLLHKLIVRLDELNLADIRLVGPDTASAPKGVEDYLPLLAKDSLVMSRMAHFGIHTYDGAAAGTNDALSNATNSGLDFWVTEFSGPCPGCDSGSPDPPGWPSAAETAKFAIDLLEQGAAGLQQYDAWDGYYEHHAGNGYWGLLAYDSRTGDYSPRKTYFVLRQLMRQTPRNSVRLAASSNQEAVRVVAFHDNATGRLVLFGQNTSDQPIDVVIRTPGASQSAQLSSSVTDAARDMRSGENAAMEYGAVRYAAPPNSVFTLNGIPTKGLNS